MSTEQHRRSVEAPSSEAGERAAPSPGDRKEPRDVVGEVVEVLPAFGVANVRAPGGLLLGLNRQTPGVNFETLEVGQRLRLALEGKHLRVTRAEAC